MRNVRPEIPQRYQEAVEPQLTNDKVAADAYYLQNRSLLLDAKILCLTFFKVFRGEGVAQTGDQCTNADGTDAVRPAA